MAVRTVTGAIRQGARELYGRLVQAGVRGVAAVSSFLGRFPQLGREAARELYDRLRGEVTTGRNLLRAPGASIIPAAGIPTSQRQISLYRAQVSVTLTDPDSGQRRTFVVRQGFTSNPTMEAIRAAAAAIAEQISERYAAGLELAEPGSRIAAMQLLSLTRRRAP